MSEPCETVRERYKLVLAILRIRGGQRPDDLYALVRRARAGFENMPQIMASLKMCNLTWTMLHRYELRTPDVIGEQEARRVLEQYGIA